LNLKFSRSANGAHIRCAVLLLAHADRDGGGRRGGDVTRNRKVSRSIVFGADKYVLTNTKRPVLES
jgi:hypothetical protein